MRSLSTDLALPPRPRTVSLEEARGYPRIFEAEVEPRFIDPMGHMNTMWYVHLFDRASWSFLASMGVDAAYMKATHSGLFAVEENLRYLGELRLGDRVEVHARLLEIHAKSLRFTLFMVDATHERLAATAELVGTHVVMEKRRSRPFPEELLAGFRSRLR